MANEAEVKFVSEPKSLRVKFGGAFLEREGAKLRVKMKPLFYLTGGLFPVIVFVLLIREPQRIHEVATVGELKAPDQLGQRGRYDIPEVANSSVPSGSTDPKARGHGHAPDYAPRVVARERKMLVPPGSIVAAKLISGASNGPVRAELTEDLSVNGEVMIPEGTVLLGHGQSGKDRLNIQFSKLIFKSGESTGVTAEALDGGDKIAGLKGSKISGYAEKLLAGIGLDFAGGIAEGLQDRQGQFGAAVAKPTMKNALLNGTAQASLDLARETLSSMRSEQPVIEVPANAPLFVIFEGE